MQIDFHHTVTYVLSRLAGFPHNEADIIAHSAQYVDDATNGGTIEFDVGALYTRISSAHHMIDKRHLDKNKSYHVWIPFHFLPGNDGQPAVAPSTGSFIHKLVCKPNSYVAKDMVAACIADKEKDYGLYRLGITMHVFADTWAHREFAGVIHDINDASLPASLQPEKKSWIQRLKDSIINRFVNDVLTLGHGAALTYPDRPYMYWEYDNGLGEHIVRKNPDEFIEAADEMFSVLQEYQGITNKKPIPQKDRDKIYELFINTKLEDQHQRHAVWLSEIRNGSFSFGPQELAYIDKGLGSWKQLAIGDTKALESGEEQYRYTSAFLTSHWKYFHDALQAHRFDVIHDILPKYGICAG